MELELSEIECSSSWTQAPSSTPHFPSNPTANSAVDKVHPPATAGELPWTNHRRCRAPPTKSPFVFPAFLRLLPQLRYLQTTNRCHQQAPSTTTTAELPLFDLAALDLVPPAWMCQVPCSPSSSALAAIDVVPSVLYTTKGCLILKPPLHRIQIGIGEAQSCLGSALEDFALWELMADVVVVPGSALLNFFNFKI